MKERSYDMKVKDGICGLVVGDALGVPVEFMRRRDLLVNPVTDMRGHGTYNMPKGTWSDDSSLTLATMKSIVEKESIDYESILAEFSLFIHNGKYTQYYTFDYGNTTECAIERFDQGVEALRCGGTGKHEMTKGSLMRILPFAFLEGIDYATIENASRITHGNELCRIACVLYVEIARSMISEDLEISEHIERSCDKVKRHYAGSSELNAFNRIFENRLDDVQSSFYVVETLECALHCLLTTSSYSEAVLKAVNFGNDTDAVAAVCGGLAGIYYGLENIPEKWMHDIPHMDDVIGLCEEYERFCVENRFMVSGTELGES